MYCAITGYGQDGPLRDRAGHDMNYLGRIGLLGLTGDADGPPVQAAGQIADLGGGALMAAFGILAALRERDRSGEGQLVDASMADGALSWLAMVAARYFAEGRAPRRGGSSWRARWSATGPYRCSDGWVTLGALEPKFWQAWCRGVGREDLIERQFEPPGSAAHAEVEAVFASRTRAEWEAFGAEHDCCLEPVLELDEALDSELVRARGMVAELAQPGAERARAAARRAGEALAHAGRPGARARAGARAPTPRPCWREAGYDERQIDALLAAGRGRRADRGGRAGRPGVKPGLKMSELADASGVSAATIKHYLREGLLGGDGRSCAPRATWPTTRRSSSSGSAIKRLRASASCRCG